MTYSYTREPKLDMFPQTTLDQNRAYNNEFDSYKLISKHIKTVVQLRRNKIL